MAYDNKTWYKNNAIKHNRDNGKPKNHDRWTTEELNFLLENYEEIGPVGVALELGRNKNGVINKATELRRSGVNIPLLSSLGIERYSHCTHAFATVNIDSSYWAGWIASDGHLRKSNGTDICTITLQRLDKEVLEHLKLWLQFTGPISDIECFLKRTQKIYPQNKLCVCGASDIVQSLVKNFNIPIGYKSLILEPPNIIQHNALSYIKGYIEGDGSLILDNHNRLTVQVLGTKTLLEWIKYNFELLLNKTIDCGINKNGNIHTFKFMKNSQEIVEEIMKLDTPYTLYRKWNKYNVSKQRLQLSI
jgi:hypothetical protein